MFGPCRGVMELVRYDAPRSVGDAVELSHMLATARVIAASALARTESRGAHVRSDFPERDDAEPVRNMVVRMRNGECSLRAVVSGE